MKAQKNRRLIINLTPVLSSTIPEHREKTAKNANPHAIERL
ncbi:hypothetical protein V4841_17480 [Lelliottia amnigena]|uniref:Uncharacterized protein n=1 Tax=Lelliottia amnigena TaxID=61646 RepID=A0ABU7UFT1_LELAM|nr:hypothetical protein [Lelliottia amnigena]